MRAVYFNLDLTLTRMDRSFGVIAETVLADSGVPPGDVDAAEQADLFFERFRALEPEPLVGAYAAYFEHHGVDADPEAAARRQRRLELDAVAPRVPDLPSLFETLAAAYPVGVLTSGLPELQRAKLEKLGLAAALDDVAVSHEVGATKESGDLFATAEDRLPADAYVYCSNHESDRDAAAAAGWETAAVDAADLPPDPVASVERAVSGRDDG